MGKKSFFLIIVILLVSVAVISAVNLAITNYKNEEKATLKATVLENYGTSILVQPDEGEDELRSSDKIVVRLPKDNAVLEDLSKFAVGSKVVITYGGDIMESYPAQINALKIEFAE
jgi:uncharacterized alpha/beta hydrolase family protein